MAFIRNNIEIEGIKQSNDVLNGGYVLNYFDNGTIFIPKSKGKIKYLNKVIIEMNSIEGRIINTPSGKILNIYGRKIYSLIYSEKSHDRAQKTVLDLPFIAYVYLPLEIDDFCNLEVSVLDAFFEVIDNRKIYNHIVYLIKFNKKVSLPKSEDSKNIESNQGQLTLSELEKMILNSPLKNVFSNNNLLQGAEPKGIGAGYSEEENIPVLKVSESKLELEENIEEANNKSEE